MKHLVTLENALKLAKLLASTAKLLGGAQPDQVKAKLKALVDVAKADWPADAPIKWEAIEAACDDIVARGATIDALIDADPV